MQRPILSLHGNARTTIIPQIQHLLDGIGNVKQVANTRLCDLMDRHGSNKNHRQHVIYTPFYHAWFRDLHPRFVLEFGIGSMDPSIPYSMNGQDTKVGGSLRAWRDYFPGSMVVGADIDRNVLFREERILCFHVDASNGGTVDAMWTEIEQELGSGLRFQLMVDDAHHEIDSNRILFERSVDRLDTGGFYIVEDVLQTDGNLASFNEWLSSCGLDALLLEIPNDTNGTCSCLAVMRRS